MYDEDYIEYNIDDEILEQEKYYESLLNEKQFEEEEIIYEYNNNHNSNSNSNTNEKNDEKKESKDEDEESITKITIINKLDKKEKNNIIEELNKEYLHSNNNNNNNNNNRYKDRDRIRKDYNNMNTIEKTPHLSSLLSYTGYVTQYPSFISVDSHSYLKERPPLGEEYSTITLPNGKRKYIYHRKVSNDISINLKDSYLSKPITEVLSEAERIKINSLVHFNQEVKSIESIQHSLEKNSNSSYNNHQFSSSTTTTTSSSSSSNTTSQKSEQLWVDKYSPKSFSQLLSPEKLNREVLRTIKLWDPYVFDREVTLTTHQKNNNYNNNGSGNGNNYTKSNESNRKERYDNNNSNDNDKDNAMEEELNLVDDQKKKDKRPFYKVILLTGPPGTGKTTLAHIVATHCGYRPVELNASDDRSIDALKDIISRSMTNVTLNSFLDSSGSNENRPNCVILDEIDGIDGRGPIDALITIIKTPLLSSNHKGKVNKGRIVLTRPLICICNDQYSPFLKDLRSISKVFHFTPPTETRLIQRLKHICLQEGLLNINTSILSGLCQSCDFDIRSAINTLQFTLLKCNHNHINDIKNESNNSKKVDYSYEMNHILSSMLLNGSKDERKDIFKLWKNIFLINDTELSTKRLSLLTALQHMNQSPSNSHLNSNLYSSSPSRSNINQTSQYQTYRNLNTMEIFDMIANYSDNHLITMGIFENYLTVKYTDPTIQRTSLAADWLSISDMFESKLYSGDSGNYSMSMYIPTIASAIHLVCSTDSKALKLQFPSKDKNARFLKQQRENILRTFYEGSAVNVPSVYSQTGSVLEFIPYLFDIISLNGSNPVRSGLKHHLSPREVERLQHVADIMVSCGLQFEKHQNLSNKSSKYSNSELNSGDEFQLEPAINLFLSYDHQDESLTSSSKRHRLTIEQKHNLFLEIRTMSLRKNWNSQQEQEQNKNEKMSISKDEQQQQLTGNKRPLEQSKTSSTSSLSTSLSTSITATISDEKLTNKKIRTSGSMASFFGKSSKNANQSNNSNNSNSNNNGGYNETKLSNIQSKKEGTRFKFNQGFTNAVKRSVKITEFLS